MKSKKLKKWSSVVVQRWRLNLLSDGIDAKEMRAVAWSFAG